MDQTSDRSKTAMNKAMLAVAVIAAVAVAGCGAASGSGAQSSSRKETTASTLAAKDSPGVKGSLPRLMSCGPRDIASVALVRAGTSKASLERLANRPMAQLTMTSGGSELAFFHPGTTSAPGAAVFSVGAQEVPADRALQSCEYMLSDRPAAQPYVTAAIDAAAARRIASSARSLRGRVNMVMVGDNPLQPGTLVVLLLVEGAPSKSGPNGQVIFGPDSSIFVVLDRGSMRVLGAAAGTW
jgi:hypothetical protein